MVGLRIERTFRIWDYRVSHDQLLLRSPARGDADRNVDIVFVGVEYLNLPSRLEGVTLITAEPVEIARAETAVGRQLDPQQVFVLSSGGHRYMVVAVAMNVLENELDLFESSLERF